MISSGPLEDRLALRELVESYNDAVMRFDADDWAANWTEDGVWSLPGMGEVAGKANIVEFWKKATGSYEVGGFFTSAGPLVVDGDTATGTWYQQEFLKTGDGVEVFVIGEYTDDYVKRDGRWFFRKRVYAIRKHDESRP